MSPRWRTRRRLLVAVAAVIALTGCGRDQGSSSATSAGPGAPASGEKGAITVLAAASLKDSFTAIGEAFEAANPGSTVTFNFGASSGLAQQITQGAPADVFASASPKNMQQVVDAKAAADPVPFARNVLAIAVPRDNPGKVTALADLGRDGVKVALCQPQVPCGDLAGKVLAASGVTVRPVTLESDVRATLTKVQLGEVDAGLVYVTDVKAAGGAVTGIEIPAAVNEATTYPIAALTGAANPGPAKAFVRFVLSAPAQAELAAAGFRAP